MAFMAAPAAPAIIGAAGSLLGGLLGRKGAKQQQAFSAQQAQKQMDFEERMSSTAHQREVKDLRAAGLNPILSATGGAGSSTPGGASAQGVNVEAPLAEGVSSSAQSAMQSVPIMKSLREAARKAKAEADSAEVDARRNRGIWELQSGGGVGVKLGDKAPVAPVGGLLKRQMEAETTTAEQGAKVSEGEAARTSAATQWMKDNPEIAKWLAPLQAILGLGHSAISLGK